MATRCFWPPDSSFGRWRAWSPSPTASSIASVRRAPLGRRHADQQQRVFDVLVGRQHRDEAEALEDEADVAGAEIGQRVVAERGRSPGRATSTVPRVGASMQPMRLSSVVLPLPEGPTTMEKRWRGMSRLMPRRAATSMSPTR